MERQARTHDYTVRGWGHDYGIREVLEDGQRLKAAGWGHGIRAGDYLILPNGERTTRYEVASIEYMPDPKDMWLADLRFAPQEEA